MPRVERRRRLLEASARRGVQSRSIGRDEADVVLLIGANPGRQPFPSPATVDQERAKNGTG
jgi:hypothetical protein